MQQIKMPTAFATPFKYKNCIRQTKKYIIRVMNGVIDASFQPCNDALTK